MLHGKQKSAAEHSLRVAVCSVYQKQFHAAISVKAGCISTAQEASPG